MEWNRDKTIQFITSYKSFALLWDCKHEFYKDRLKRHEALEVLAKQFGTQTTEIERKIKNLQSHFLRERKRILASKKEATTTWFAYKPLTFLLTRDSQRQRVKPNPAKSSQNKASQALQNQPQIVPTQVCVQSPSTSHDGNPEKLPESYSLMKEMFKMFKERDEFDLFGEQIAIKLRNIQSPYARVTVQNRMNMLLMEAELGMYDNESHYNAPEEMAYYPVSEAKADVDVTIAP